MNQSVPLVLVPVGGTGAPVWHGVDAVNATHTGDPQHVLTAQNDPLGQVKVGDAPQGPIAPQLVLPRTQYPPPNASRTHTQDELELQGTNVAQVAPAHSGFGPPLA